MEKMSTTSVREIVRRKRREYLKGRKSEKRLMLDEVEGLTGYHRKSLIRLFMEGARTRKAPIRRPRASRYEGILDELKLLWAAAFYACGKRLQPFLPELLPVMKRCGEIKVTPDEESLLLSMSAATIDRMLKSERKKLGVRGRTLTKPGTLLKSRIAVRTFADWNENEPGFFELDLVGHCGGSGSGEFLYTLNMTDVFSGWTVLGGMKGRGRRGTIEAIATASGRIPFAVRGIDSDNDSAFINYHLAKYCRERDIKLTRGREYKKNDQCYVEQKNWSVVRQFIGYRRFETDEELDLLRKIYPLVSAYHNFFSPMMRLIEKKRDGSRVTKRYAAAATPYRRLIESNGHIDSKTRESLMREYESLNPVDLLRRIGIMLRRLENLSDSTAGRDHGVLEQRPPNPTSSFR